MHGNQQPEEIDAYEDCIYSLTQSSENPDETVHKIKQFGANFANQTPEDCEYLGFLMNGAVAASPEIIDIDDPKSAVTMFLHGAMAGLYVGDTMLGENMSTKDVLTTSRYLINDGAREFFNDVTEFIAHLNPDIKQILDGWKSRLDSESIYGSLFDIGFGMTMCSVNKTIREIDLLNSLENSVDWEELDHEKSLPVALQSLDDDCLRLAEAFRDHSAVCGLADLSGEERRGAVRQVAKLLETDLAAVEDLRISDHVQTRGMGICINFDEQGQSGDVCEFDDDLKVKGTIVGMECMPVPTEFAILMGITEGDDIYEPQLCLMLKDVEVTEPSGEVTPQEGMTAIPLRVSGTTQLDKIIYRAEQ